MKTWKQLKEFAGYAINQAGKVKNLKTGRILKNRISAQGYEEVSVKGKTRRIHRLLAKAFIPKPEGKNIINHKNGIKDDNRLQNLEWCTQQENVTHAMDVLGYRETMGAKIRESHLAKRTPTIYPWKIGKKKFRVLLSTGKPGKNKTVGYFDTYEEAHDAWVKAYTAHYGINPLKKEVAA